MTAIAANLAIIKSRVKAAAEAAGRDPADINLIAVSKTKPEQDVHQALIAGQLCFGENRVQEAGAKFSGLRRHQPGLELHLIGPLQTNKAEDAVKIFDVIQTLDRTRLADALAAGIRKTGRKPRLFIQVNTGAEPQKAGVSPDNLSALLDYSRTVCGLEIAGLMCIPPQSEEPEPHFRQLAQLAGQFGLARLSMGMSHDFETAIRCGATDIRVGTAIFGARSKPA